MDKRLVSLKTFDNYADAELYRSALAARGFRAELAGQNTGSTFGLFFGALSRVSVVATEETARRLGVVFRDPARPLPSPARLTCRSLQPHTPIRLPRRRNPSPPESSR